MNVHELCKNYKSEFIFGGVLLVCVILSCILVQNIPARYYDSLSLIMNCCITTISLSGAWLMARHTKGMLVRRVWVFNLLANAFFAMLLVLRVTSFVDDTPNDELVGLAGWEIVVGNFLLWLLLLYPMLVLRPGWMTVPRALLQGLPVGLAVLLDQMFDIDLRILLAIYPVLLLGLLISYIRKYRQYCEENYSSMDNIDVQWIVRYIIMYLLDGALFFILCFFPIAPIVITQQWLILLMIAYSTEQILYRNDPWATVRSHKHNTQESEEHEEEENTPSIDFAQYRETLEQWMKTEKPYLNPEFRLLDLRQVLPLNRTYLSQLINTEYGCNFYQFVTNYRIEEAKQLMKAHPDMLMQDIAEQCGFSSPTVFARIFSREVGMTPTEWNKQ